MVLRSSIFHSRVIGPRLCPPLAKRRRFSASLSSAGRFKSPVRNDPRHPTSRIPTRAVYVPVPRVEKIERYSIGGYHAVTIDDTFKDGRYKVVHKLGFGRSSTAWLARGHKEKRYVCLKIFTARASRWRLEASLLNRMWEGPRGLRGRQFIPLIHAEFSFKGPNGQHLCLVQEPALFTLAKAKDSSSLSDFMFPIETARFLAAQLAMGLEYVHYRKVCHGGKATCRFVLNFLKDLRGLTEYPFRYQLEKHSSSRPSFRRPDCGSTTGALSNYQD